MQICCCVSEHPRKMIERHVELTYSHMVFSCLFQITTCVLLSIGLSYSFCMCVPEPSHHFPSVYTFKWVIVFDIRGVPWDPESLTET